MFRHAILWSDSLAPSSHSGSLATPLFGQSLMALSASLSLLYMHALVELFTKPIARRTCSFSGMKAKVLSACRLRHCSGLTLHGPTVIYSHLNQLHS